MAPEGSSERPPFIRTRDLLKDIHKIHRSALQVMCGFIVGFDSDTPSIFQRQIDFIQKSGIVSAMVGMLQAPSATRLFERLMREQHHRARSSDSEAEHRGWIHPGKETV